MTGDLSDRAAIDRAMTGIHTLIHLAATPDDADFLSELLPNNLAGLYQVMDSARLAGVRRVVLASSGQMNWWQQLRGPWPVNATHPITPRYWYAATKAFMEAIGYGFSQSHPISVVVVRLGWCPRTPGQADEIEAAEWAKDVYLSPGDAGRFFADCVEAPESLSHALVNVASRPYARARVDLNPARELLGYVPQDVWPAGIEVIRRGD